jgi:hypothetical protein
VRNGILLADALLPDVLIEMDNIWGHIDARCAYYGDMTEAHAGLTIKLGKVIQHTGSDI